MKRKGFTLIELLAVIVIIAIIALIITPTILGVIEKAKKGAFEQSVRGIIKTADVYYTSNMGEIVEDDIITFKCNGKTCEDKNGNKLEFKGTVPTSGQVVLTGRQEISVESLRMNGYCASGTNNNLQIAKDCKGIDLTKPELELGNIQITTKSIIIPISKNEDPDSGIKQTTCFYGKDKNYGNTEKINTNSCVINGNSGETYYYKIETENGLGLTTSKTGEATIGNIGVEFSLSQIPTETTYAQSKTVNINYKANNITKPSYYLKTTVNTIIDIDAYSCEGSIEPENCTNETTKNLEANTWYKVDKTVKVTFKDNGTIYTLINDGDEYLTAETLTISKIDTTAPTASLTAKATNTKVVTLTAICTDNESGISKYEYSKDNGSTWDKGTSESYTYTGLKTGTNYNFKVRCTNGVGKSTTSNAVSGTTTSFAGITITPNTTNWSTSKTVTITGSTEGSTLQYRILSGSTVKQDWTEYTKALTIDWEASTTTPTIIYARFYDGTNYSGEETFTITTIDRTSPENVSITPTALTGSKPQIQVSVGGTDSGSGIQKYEIYYGTSASTLTSTKTITTTSVVIDVTAGGNYYFKVRVYDNAGNYKDSNISSVIKACLYSTTYYSSTNYYSKMVYYSSMVYSSSYTTYSSNSNVTGSTVKTTKTSKYISTKMGSKKTKTSNYNACGLQYPILYGITLTAGQTVTAGECKSTKSLGICSAAGKCTYYPLVGVQKTSYGVTTQYYYATTYYSRLTTYSSRVTTYASRLTTYASNITTYKTESTCK